MITNHIFLIPRSLIFQTLTNGPNIIHCLKYQRATTSGRNDLWIRTLGFVIIAHLL